MSIETSSLFIVETNINSFPNPKEPRCYWATIPVINCEETMLVGKGIQMCVPNPPFETLSLVIFRKTHV